MSGADQIDQVAGAPALAPWRGWLWSGVLLTLSLLYLAYPDDLIPDSAPYGLTDDMAVLALGLIASFLLAPAASRLPVLNWARFRIRVLRADLGNFGPLQHRYVDGFVFSGKNSGSHWVKYMLSLALAEKYGIEPPRFCSGREADRIVGRADRTRCGRDYPQIATSHTIPSIVLSWIKLPSFVRQPPIVLLVRDIPDALVSGYRKWQDRYGVGLAEFVHGDPGGKRFIADVWWYIHFFNRWGAMWRRQPDRILLVRYEALLIDPQTWLAQIAMHLQLDLSTESLMRAVSLANKDRMRELQDPDAGETIVPSSAPAPALSPSHRRVLQAALQHYLRADFGYGASAGVRSGGSAAEDAARAR